MLRPSSIAAALAASLIAAPALAQYPGHPETRPDINAADLSARDKAISDDSFEGRGPGTRNGEAAAQWSADQWKRLGPKPGTHAGCFSRVPPETPAMVAGLEPDALH